MATHKKKDKPTKKRASKYESKVRFEGTFEEMVAISITESGLKKQITKRTKMNYPLNMTYKQYLELITNDIPEQLDEIKRSIRNGENYTVEVEEENIRYHLIINDQGNLGLHQIVQ